MTSPPGPLAGLRVLDVATMLAGPYGATLLGDLGADVIKIESHYGDDTRHLGPEVQGERSAFISLNRNKRSLVIDLRMPEGKAVFARIAKTADVVITNVREPALSKLGLAYEQVCEHRPDVIWVDVTAFGADGPYAGRPGIDFLAQGFAGMLSLTGEPGQQPLRVAIPVVDVMTSLLAVNGILTALHVRGQTGQGQRIDVSLLDALVHAQCTGLGSYLVGKVPPPKVGNRSQYLAPSGVYACADGKQLCLTCPSDKFFRNMAIAFDTDWANDPRFATNDDRLANHDALDEVIAAGCKRFGRDELVERLVAADVLTAPVNEIEDVVRDPQIRHNGMLTTVDHPTLGPIEVTGVPVHLQKTPGSVRLSPPLLGQHTEEILGELGYDAGDVEALLRERTVGKVAG